MEFWYFKFEGKFAKGSPNYGDGIFSACMVPESNYEQARSIFLNSLNVEDILLVEIIEEFSIDGHELDSSDIVNDFWIDLYRNAKSSGSVVYDTWHLFALEN